MVDSTGRYFNEKIIEANKIDIPEFIRYTEIGKHQNRKKLGNMREAEYVQENEIAIGSSSIAIFFCRLGNKSEVGSSIDFVEELSYTGIIL